jgi:hypothetical protein
MLATGERATVFSSQCFPFLSRIVFKCGRVCCDIWYIFLIPQFLRHQTMDKVQKHNSFNTNTPSSESYRIMLDELLGLLWMENHPNTGQLKSVDTTQKGEDGSSKVIRNVPNPTTTLQHCTAGRHRQSRTYIHAPCGILTRNPSV